MKFILKRGAVCVGLFLLAGGCASSPPGGSTQADPGAFLQRAAPAYKEWMRERQAARDALARKDFAEAEKQFRGALTLAATMGFGHDYFYVSNGELAGFYCDRGQHQKAKDLCLRSLERARPAIGANGFWAAGLQAQLGMVHMSAQEYAEAEKCLDLARHQAAKTVSPSSRHYLYFLVPTGENYRRQKRFKEAEAIFVQALIIVKDENYSTHYRAPERLNNYFVATRWERFDEILHALTLIQLQLGQRDLAQLYARERVEKVSAELPRNDPRLAPALALLAEVERGAGGVPGRPR